MNWNDAAEDLLNQVLAQTPRPVRDATEAQLRGTAEAIAEEDGKNRVGVETVIAAWVTHSSQTISWPRGLASNAVTARGPRTNQSPFMYAPYTAHTTVPR